MPNADRFGRLPWLWITVVVFVLDQVTKAFFQAELTMYQQIVVIPDLFSWTLAYNTGAAFSFLADSSGWQRWLFALIAIVVSVPWMAKEDEARILRMTSVTRWRAPGLIDRMLSSWRYSETWR